MAETLILDRAEIKALVSPREALEPMRNAFRLYSTQRTAPTLRVPSPLPAPAPSDAGAMILVPGVVAGIPAYTVKVHAKYPAHDPAIQGIIILSSLETGDTLAILESGFLTALRTGLAGAIAANVLAHRDAQTVAIVGAGVQGILQLEMLLLVRPITRARVYDISADRTREFAARNSSRLGIEIEPADNLDTAIRDSDIVVTATGGTEPFLHPVMIRPGTHICKELYERTIDFGGHPNLRGVLSNMMWSEAKDKRELRQIYLHTNEATILHALKSTAQAGLCSLHLFQHVFQSGFCCCK
jgi:ornithine cyclodeaminase/alanine dehydrogenase-like protein (mu-crystallin family)